MKTRLEAAARTAGRLSEQLEKMLREMERRNGSATELPNTFDDVLAAKDLITQVHEILEVRAESVS